MFPPIPNLKNSVPPKLGSTSRRPLESLYDNTKSLRKYEPVKLEPSKEFLSKIDDELKKSLEEIDKLFSAPVLEKYKPLGYLLRYHHINCACELILEDIDKRVANADAILNDFKKQSSITNLSMTDNVNADTVNLEESPQKLKKLINEIYSLGFKANESFSSNYIIANIKAIDKFTKAISDFYEEHCKQQNNEGKDNLLKQLFKSEPKPTSTSPDLSSLIAGIYNKLAKKVENYHNDFLKTKSAAALKNLGEAIRNLKAAGRSFKHVKGTPLYNYLYPPKTNEANTSSISDTKKSSQKEKNIAEQNQEDHLPKLPNKYIISPDHRNRSQSSLLYSLTPKKIHEEKSANKTEKNKISFFFNARSISQCSLPSSLPKIHSEEKQVKNPRAEPTSNDKIRNIMKTILGNSYSSH